jgi:transposase
VAKEVGLDLRGAYVNLDGGFDSRANRTCIFNAGMIPNIKENPRNRKHTKRGRLRFFNAAIHALRMRVERTFAWEDKFKRLLLRFERIQQRHYGMKSCTTRRAGSLMKAPRGGQRRGERA